MPAPTHYSQCRLVKQDGRTRRVKVSYIPTEFAIVGSVLRLRELGTWHDGWTVEAVGAPDRLPGKAKPRAVRKRKRA
jgi:hypothetical protein